MDSEKWSADLIENMMAFLFVSKIHFKHLDLEGPNFCNHVIGRG